MEKIAYSDEMCHRFTELLTKHDEKKRQENQKNEEVNQFKQNEKHSQKKTKHFCK